MDEGVHGTHRSLVNWDLLHLLPVRRSAAGQHHLERARWQPQPHHKLLLKGLPCRGRRQRQKPGHPILRQAQQPSIVIHINQATDVMF